MRRSTCSIVNGNPFLEGVSFEKGKYFPFFNLARPQRFYVSRSERLENQIKNFNDVPLLGTPTSVGQPTVCIIGFPDETNGSLD